MESDNSKKKRRKALFACSNYWESPIHVGDHQLAREFATHGWDVAFLSAPLTPLHILKTKEADIKERWSIYKAGGVWDENINVWSYIPGALLASSNAPLLRSEWILRNWTSLTFPNLCRKLRHNGFQDVELMYIRDSRFMGLLKSVNFDKSVFRLADYDRGLGLSSNTVEISEKYIASNVDLVAYTAGSLKKYVDRLEPNDALYLPNGVEYAHFSGSQNVTPEKMKSIPKPIVIYVGSFGRWFDYDMVNLITERLQDISFVFIGSETKELSRLHIRKNVHYLGPIAYKYVPFYLKMADVGIIPFNARDYPRLVNAINPLKLYEYMAAGLPVVASDWEELHQLDTPALLCKRIEEFEGAIKKLSRTKPDEDMLRHFAASQDWSMRYKSLCKKLKLV